MTGMRSQAPSPAVEMGGDVGVTANTIGCNGWNADPSDGLNLKPTVGLNKVDGGDNCWSAVSVDFKHTLFLIDGKEKRNKLKLMNELKNLCEKLPFHNHLAVIVLKIY